MFIPLVRRGVLSIEIDASSPPRASLDDQLDRALGELVSVVESATKSSLKDSSLSQLQLECSLTVQGDGTLVMLRDGSGSIRLRLTWNSPFKPLARGGGPDALSIPGA